MAQPPEFTGFRSPFDETLGVRVTESSAERVVALLPVRPELHQPSGVVHGGVYATLVETVASIAANLWLAEQAGVAPGQTPTMAMGISNTTDFLRAVRDGELRAEATPLQRGRTLQLWQVDITDASGRRVAHGQVKLMNVPVGGAAGA